MEQYLYLALNAFTISYPLYKSFDPRVNFHRRWPELALAVLLVGGGFLLWDHLFTAWGVWSFNPRYVAGWYMAGLPLEEWLFFLTVPFACVFIHEVLRYFVKGDPLGPIAVPLTWGLGIALLVLAAWHHDRLYTCVNFGLAGAALLLHLLPFFGRRHLGRFYLTYLVHLIPFSLVNGVLTAMPVVAYNNAENLGIRLGTIPAEDLVYSMLLLLLNLSLYEYVGGMRRKRATEG
jgi:lycopene cyclase domain-containing protein